MKASKNVTLAQQAGASAHHAIDAASEAVMPMVDRVSSGAHGVVDTVTDAVASAAESLAARTEKFREAKTSMSDTCSTYLRAHPVAYIGVAAAAVYLISRKFIGTQ